MAKWKVWNRHPDGLMHREKFKDQLVEIPAGGFVVMDYEDAVQFRGQYFPMRKNAQGAPDPASFKVLTLERHELEAVADTPKEFVCHFDGAKFPSQSLLDAYLKQNFSEHVIKDEALEAAIEKEAQAKRGPGRPAKEKSA
jgi:hypothetical protein